MNMNKKWIDERVARLNQQAKLLINNPEFQSEIARLRAKWNIPPDGMKSNDESQEWYRWQRSQERIWQNEAWFKVHRPHILALRENNSTFREIDEYTTMANATNPINDFGHDLAAVLKQFKLGPSWLGGVRQHLFSNASPHYGHPIGVTINSSQDKQTGLQLLRITISEDTTLDDIIYSWPNIIMHQQELLYKNSKKYQPYRNLNRNQRAYELTVNQGIKAVRVAEMMSKELGEEFVYTDIYSFVKQHKKKLDTN